MRCWHKDLIPVLPRQQLLGQWRECCGIARDIAKNGTPDHILVNRILDYPLEHFVTFAQIVILEMESRGYKPNSDRFFGWIAATDYIPMSITNEALFSEWHNNIYLRQCLYNLEEKAICGGMEADEWKLIYESFKDFTPLWCGK